MGREDHNHDAIIDSDCSIVFSTQQTKRDGQDRYRMPTRPQRRYRRNIYRKRRIQPPSTITWAQRLFVVSLIAALSKTNERFAPVCDAFVTPTSRSTIAIRSEQWQVFNTENRNNKRGIGTISKRISRSIGVSTCLSSNGPASRNDMTGGANNNNNNNKGSSNKSNDEIAGFVLAVAIILSLAGMAGPSGSGLESSDEVSQSVAVMTKVVENTVPTTSTEVVAVTLGESIGGVIGAIFSVAINFVLRGGKADDDSSKSLDSDDSENKKSASKPSLLSQGLSDSDYFIANSASNSLLEAAGVPESIAKYSSVFIAAIPSQLVKLGPILQKQKQKLSLTVIDEQQRKAKRKLTAMSSLWKNKKKKKVGNPKKFVPVAVAAAAAGEAASSTTSVTTEATAAAAVSVIDFVEVFADVTRWLEYDVLKTEYGETALSQLWMVGNNLAAINPLQSAITFSLLGSLAAVSSRWYADILYGRFQYGPIEKQQEVRNRNSAEWFSIYSSTAASAAALFGCYEFFQLPIGRYIQGTLAGGVEGCVGSSKFNACMQTYIETNSPGPSAEAQLRALVTNLYAVYIRLQDIAGDTTTDDMSALIRAWSVSIASYIANMQ